MDLDLLEGRFSRILLGFCTFERYFVGLSPRAVRRPHRRRRQFVGAAADF